MMLSRECCGVVILAGGRSRRMGTCQALLTIEGETMLSRLTRQLDDFQEKLLSTNTPALAEGLPLTPVPDFYPGAGPLAGLHAALSVSRSSVLFCIPCDMPNFIPTLPRLLLERYNGEDALVCRDGAGWLYPLCGFYAKTALPALETQLKQKQYRATALLDKLQCTVADMGGVMPDNVFFNMNTPEEFRDVTKNDRKL